MNEAPFVLWLDDESAPGNSALGGKFGNLAELTAAGLPVPDGFGITVAAYRHFLESSGLAEEARRVRQATNSIDLREIGTHTAPLLNGIATAALPADLEQQIRESYAELERRCRVSNVPVAVRSSGESEDLQGASFAGQYDTFLWISGIDALFTHMRRCWAGMFGVPVLTYRPGGQPVASDNDFGMCVGVQRMIPARAAGVIFTLNPLNGDRSKIVLECCWGLGEGVVKGDITPNRFTVDKVTFEIINRQQSTQSHEYRFNPAAGGVTLAPLEQKLQSTFCVSDAEVLELAKLAKRIERDRGAPQDLEFAISDSGEIWLLQVRPETIWSRRAVEAIMPQPKSSVAHVLARLSGVRLNKRTADGAGN